MQADAFLSGMQTTMQAMQADMLQYQEQSMQALAALSSRIAQVRIDVLSDCAASLHTLLVIDPGKPLCSHTRHSHAACIYSSCAHYHKVKISR